MTPKDKAKELVDRFYQSKISTNEFRHEEAKQCALICIDKIIEEVREYCDDNFHHQRMGYWQEVKQEVQKL